MNRIVGARVTCALVATLCIATGLMQFAASANQPHWSQMATTGVTREYNLLAGMMAQNNAHHPDT